MVTKAGVGISNHRHINLAAEEATQKALTQAQIAQPDFVFMFSSVAYEQEKLLLAVRKATGYAPLAGCSGWGLIAGTKVDNTHFAVAVMVISSEELKFTNYLSQGLRENPQSVGEAIAREINPRLGEEAVALFLFADGKTINFDRLALGLEQELQCWLPFLGGVSGGSVNLDVTYQYYNDQVIQDSVVATLLRGQGRVAWAVNHGCEPIGTERKITRAKGNIIYEIDHQPVLEVLQEYLQPEEIEEWNQRIVNLCIGFKTPTYMKDYDEYVIRFIPAKDDATGSIMLQTEVEEGASIWMTRRNQDKITHGLDKVSQEIKSQLGNNPAQLILQFDCFGRGIIFRQQQRAELLQRLQKNLGDQIPWLGLYTNGEIAPVEQKNCFHNYTLVIAAIY